jgi:hypothetical protein
MPTQVSVEDLARVQGEQDHPASPARLHLHRNTNSVRLTTRSRREKDASIQNLSAWKSLPRKVLSRRSRCHSRYEIRPSKRKMRPMCSLLKVVAAHPRYAHRLGTPISLHAVTGPQGCGGGGSGIADESMPDGLQAAA